MLEIIKTYHPDPRNLNYVYHALIKYYLDSGQYSTADLYIKKLDQSRRNEGNKMRNRATYHFKFRLDTALGNYKSAVSNLVEYKKLTDSIWKENSTRQIKQLEIEYQTEIQKNRIESLSQQNAVTQARLDGEKLIRNFSIAGIGL